jgi:hypothetical protein
MKIETMLHDEIQNEFEELKRMQLGGEEYRTTIDGLTKLVDRAVEIDKFNAEYQEKVDAREIENNLKMKQMADERKDRIWKNILTGLGIGVPAGLTIWGTLKSLKFEETGTVTTMMGRGFINKLLPKK